MTAVDNEKLCALAQNGNMDALNSLVENNLRFIKMTAHEIWSAQIEVNRALGVTFDDLVQEGCECASLVIGLDQCRKAVWD